MALSFKGIQLMFLMAYEQIFFVLFLLFLTGDYNRGNCKKLLWRVLKSMTKALCWLHTKEDRLSCNITVMSFALSPIHLLYPALPSLRFECHLNHLVRYTHRQKMFLQLHLLWALGHHDSQRWLLKLAGTSLCFVLSLIRVDWDLLTNQYYRHKQFV